MFKYFFGGILMGIANLIPGISGGTMAVITGIYNDLIISITQVFKFKKEGFKILFFVGLGILVSIFSGAKVFEFGLENYPFYMYSLFFGLILASIFYLKSKINFRFLPTIFGIILVLLPNFLPHSNTISNLKIFLGGFLGGAAMIIPGLSGSLMLLILGIYDKAILALSNLDIKFLSFLGFGVILGIYSVARLIKWALNKNKDFVDNFVLGLIIGSLYPIFPSFHGKGNIFLGMLIAILGYLMTLLIEKIDSNML
ncbi:MAG: putative rane protein [Thermosipho sp. (in: thermotogales)]|nr:putative rane protein [Thermosipho sp. (in: thermotogales)]